MTTKIALTLSVITLTLAQPLHAAVQYWDSDGSGANNNCSTGVGLGGSANWSTALAFWTASGCGTGTDVGWTEGNDAFFWGTAGTVTLSGPRTVGNMTFATTGYTITASTLTFNGGHNITVNSGTATLTSCTMAGTVGYNVIGPGTFFINTTAGTISGPVNVNSGGILRLVSKGAIGSTSAGAGTITLDNGTLRSDEVGVATEFVTANRSFVIGSGGGTFNLQGASTILTCSNSISGSGNTLTVTGVTTADMRMVTNANAVGGHNTFSKLVMDGPLMTLGTAALGAADDSFGAVPASFLADAITLKNSGKIRGNVNNMTLNANRGITIGTGGGSIGAVGGFTLTVPGQITGSALLKINENTSSQDTGAVTLTADNSSTLTSKIFVKGGGLNFNTDNNFGAVPGSPTADALTLTNGSFIAFNQTGALAANRGITIGNGSSGIIAVVSGVTGTVNGIISGTGNLTKSSATGSLVLAGANTYSGKTTVSGGSLTVSSLNSVGSPSASSSLGRPTTVANGTIAIGSGTANTTLIYTGSGETSDRVIDMTGTTGNTIVQADGSGALILTAVNTASANGAKNFTLSGTSTANNSIGKIVDSTAATTINKSGAGTWTLTAANTHTGGTQITGNGLLNFGNANALSTGTFSFTGGGQFDNTTGSDLTVANAMTLSGGSATYVGSANNMTFNGLTSITGATRTFTVSARTLTLAGGVGQDASNRGLTKAGNGTLVIQGTCTYGGATTVSAGTLRVDGSIASSSSVTVSASGTLAGNGTTSAVTVNGTISPGASPGTLTTGAATLAGGGNYIWEINDFNGSIGTAYDTINAASANITATTGSKFNIKVTSLNGTSAGQAANFTGTTDYDFTILHTTGAITGNGAAAINIDISAFQNTLGNGGFWFVTVGANDIVLSYRRAAFITSNPSGLALNAGQTANFSGSATASGSVSYQWKKGASNLSNGSQPGGSVVSGATTADLTVSGVTYQDEGAYALVATGTYGAAATSTTASLTVSDPPIITSPTSDSTVVKDAGENLVLSVTQTGRVGTYQWKKGAGNLSNGAVDNAATVSGATTANLTLSSVRGADAGIYSVVLTTSDGNATSANTTLQVNDPAISVQPASSTFECGSSNALTVTAFGTTNANGVLTYQWYTPDPSGTAITDATNAFLSFPVVSFANAGNYSVVVSNALGNSITSSVAVVTIQDSVAPVIIVSGGDATVECHTSYSDEGASATDGCDGSVSVSTSGLPNANATGIYTITYSATDSHSNTSTATRVVTVNDTIAPTITMLGSDVTISCGGAYSDAGATASDSCAGNLTSQISVNYGGLNTSAPVAGVYTITYSVTDGSNPATPQHRMVTVIDNTAPVVTLLGGAVVTNECHTVFADPGATASDACAGNVTGSIVISGNLDTNTVAVYTLTYTADDGAGNTNSSVTRVVHVTDTVAPVVTLNGPSAITVECHGSYSDPSASADDACNGSISAVQSGTVDLNTIGVYTRTYTATDASGNANSTTRQISVEDHTAPAITVTGDNPANVECHAGYTDAGATVTDACDAGVTVGSNGPVDANTPGNYTITYSSTDAAGNNSTATRTVVVADHTSPVVSLIGSDPMTVECHSSFVDPGATVSDACDTGATYSTIGSVDANTPGNYTLTYSSTDLSSNTGTATRVVNVTDTLAPVVSLTGLASMTVECHSAFVDPGSSANDACEGPVSVTVTGSVDTNSVGFYTLTYSACDGGNRCSSVTRVVHVNDSAAPTVTVTGDNPMPVECHSSFIDPGATAADDCDALPNVVTTGTVNPNAVGNYTLTYTATDADGNSGSATRVVNVSDTTAPVITVTSGDQTVECHTIFSDPGATAADACDGDVSANIVVSGDTVNANTPGVYTLTYAVSDSSSNNISATRTVTVSDTVGPVITLNGLNPASACQFQPYTDAGSSADDACSGSVIPSVSGSVDTSVAGSYTLTYTADDGNGNTTTTNRVVVVAPCGITIIDPPHNVTIDANSSFTLSVDAAANVPLTYQWKKGASIIPGANSSAYIVAHAFRTNAGTYSVDVIGTTTTNVGPAVVTVNDPSIVTSPASYTVNLPVETKHAFSVVAAGTGTLKYQWFLGSAKITGATTSAYTVTGITAGFNGRQYSCSVSNVGAAHAAVSATATLTVYQVPKVVAAVPTTQPKFIGQTAYLKVTAAPATALPVHYQWVNASSIALADGPSGTGSTYSGTQTSMLTIQNLQLGDTGSYRCLMTNATAVNVFSLPATVTVKDYTNAPVVVIVRTNQNAKITDTTPVLMTGTVTDKGLITAVWMTQTTTQGTITNDGLTFVYKTNALHQQLTGNVLWTNVVSLVPGTNAFFVYAQNDKGTNGVSKPARTVFYLVPSTLVVQTNGSGTITPTLTSYGTPKVGTDAVYLGIGYTLKAVPKANYHFTGWTDGTNPFSGDTGTDQSNPLHFIMTNAVQQVIQANFQHN